jgi:hypothetical protein
VFGIKKGVVRMRWMQMHLEMCQGRIPVGGEKFQSMCLEFNVFIYV